MVRRLFVSLAVLVGVLVALDFGLRLYSQSVVGSEIQASLDLSEKPHVSFGGWPFVTHVISGEMPSASFEADTVAEGGVKLRDVALTLEDVKFPSSRLLSGGGGVIHAKTGHGSAVLTAADVNAALRKSGVPLKVSISEGRAAVELHGLKIGLNVELDGDTLVLSPSAVDAVTAQIDLPSIAHGVRYTDVKLEDEEVVLTVALRNAVFVIPPSK